MNGGHECAHCPRGHRPRRRGGAPSRVALTGLSVSLGSRGLEPWAMTDGSESKRRRRLDRRPHPDRRVSERLPGSAAHRGALDRGKRSPAIVRSWFFEPMQPSREAVMSIANVESERREEHGWRRRQATVFVDELEHAREPCPRAAQAVEGSVRLDELRVSKRADLVM